MMSKNIARVLAFVMLVSSLSIPCVQAEFNGFTDEKTIPNKSTGTVLTDGTVYNVTTNTSVTDLRVAPNSVVKINIAPNTTLSANGSATKAGIYLPESSMLILTGGGTVNATGGDATKGKDGEKGGSGSIDAVTVTWHGGAGGKGGDGGTGAGAGIGTDGALGGIGGVCEKTKDVPCNPSSVSNVMIGGDGANGQCSENMGTLYIDNVTVNAKGGKSGSAGFAGPYGSHKTSDKMGFVHSYNDYYAGSGGGGAGGGGGLKGNDIGSGGPGAGGGGAGGSGWTTTTTNDIPLLCNGAGGHGGIGEPTGKDGVGNLWSEQCNIWHEQPDGGFGGHVGKYGSNGICHNSTIPESTSVKVTFDNSGSEDVTTEQTVFWGEQLNRITVPNKTGYLFEGYYDSETDGIKYVNKDGTSARIWDKTSDTVLYARWIKIGANIQLYINNELSNDLYISSVDNFAVLPTPNVNLYKFLGWYDNRNLYGNPVKYIDCTNNQIVKLYAKLANIYNGCVEPVALTTEDDVTTCTSGLRLAHKISSLNNYGFIVFSLGSKPKLEIIKCGESLSELKESNNCFNSELTESAPLIITPYVLFNGDVILHRESKHIAK